MAPIRVIASICIGTIPTKWLRYWRKHSEYRILLRMAKIGISFLFGTGNVYISRAFGIRTGVEKEKWYCAISSINQKYVIVFFFFFFANNGSQLSSWKRTALFMNHSYEHLDKKLSIHENREKNLRILLVLLNGCKFTHKKTNRCEP